MKKECLWKPTLCFDVVIPIFRVKTEWVDRCLHSVVNQTYPNRRIWVCDGTPEDSHLYEEVKRLISSKYPEVEYVRQTGTGVSQARNQVAEMGSAPFIAFLDGDDWWDLEWLENARTWIQENGFEGIATLVGYGEGKQIMKSMMSGREWEIDVRFHTHDYDSWLFPYHGAFVRKNPVFPSFAIVSRKGYERVEGFDETIGLYEDTIFFCEMCGGFDSDEAFKVARVDALAGYKESHAEGSALQGKQSGYFAQETSKGVSHCERVAYERLNRMDIDSLDLDEPTKEYLKRFEIGGKITFT